MISSRAPSDSQWSKIERQLEKFEEQWRTLQRPKIKEFLAEPASPCTARLLLELVKLDLEYSEAAGESKSIAEYVAEFPQYLKEPTCIEELELEKRRVLHQFAATQASDSANDNATARSQPLPQRVGRYEVREQIGSGGFASVYRAWDPQLKREVAIKLPKIQLQVDGECRMRMLREAQGAARLHHPGIIPIHEVGEQAGTVFIVYEYIRGESLAQHIRHTPLGLRQAAQFIMALSTSLHYAHQCGVVHRDVKPANILLNHEGVPLIGDFGLALLEGAEELLTREGDILGTPAYMSPEQASGNAHGVDARTDVYSAGVILYELLSGRRPFEGSSISVLRQVVQNDPATPSAVLRKLQHTSRLSGSSSSSHVAFSFRDLETICLKAMAKEPARRYQSAAELADDLLRFLNHQPIHARRTSPLGRLGLWCQRRPAVAATVFASALIVCGVACFSYLQVRQERDRFLLERQSAEANLYQALVREAQALRIARLPGFRDQAWQRLAQAAQIDTPMRDLSMLRHEAVANMGDFVGVAPTEWRDFDAAGSAVSAAFHCGDNQVAIGFSSGLVRIFDCRSGMQLEELVTAHASGVFEVLFTPDGNQMILGDDQGSISVWRRELEQWRPVNQFRIDSSSEINHVHPISIYVTADGRSLLACSKSSASATLFDSETGVAKQGIAAQAGEIIYRAAVSPDGEQAAILYFSEKLAIWDIANNTLQAQIQLEPGSGMNVVYSPDGERVAVSFKSGAGVYDAASLSRANYIRGSIVFDCDFLADSMTLAVPLHDRGLVELWDAHNNTRVATLNHSGQPHSVVASDSGEYLITMAAGSVRLWNLRGGPETTWIDRVAPVTGIAFSPDDRWLMSGCADGGISVWDTIDQHQYAFTEGLGGNARAMDFSTNGLLATASLREIQIWDATRLPEAVLLTSILYSSEHLWSVTFSPDGRYLVAAGIGGVRIWAIDATDRSHLRYQEHSHPTSVTVGSLAFSTDSTKIAFVDQGARVHYWDIEARRALEIGYLEAGISQGLAFSPSGNSLIGVDSFGIIHVKDLRSGLDVTLEESSDEDQGWTHREIALSPSGDWLLHRCPTLSLWDLPQKKRLFQLPGHALLSCFAWSRNQDRVAIGFANGEIAVWDLREIRKYLRKLQIEW